MSALVQEIMRNSYDDIRQIRRYLTTIELELMDDQAIVERCACEAIKLLGQLAGIGTRDVCNLVPISSSNREERISGSSPDNE